MRERLVGRAGRGLAGTTEREKGKKQAGNKERIKSCDSSGDNAPGGTTLMEWKSV